MAMVYAAILASSSTMAVVFPLFAHDIIFRLRREMCSRTLSAKREQAAQRPRWRSETMTYSKVTNW